MQPCCGHALETTEHFLLCCNRYEKERKDMFDFYLSVWHYYEAKSKLHNNRSIVVVTIM